MSTRPLVVATAALLLLVPGAGRTQTYFGSGGGDYGVGQALGTAAVVLVVVGVIIILVRHKPTITGCVQAVDGTSTLIDDKRKYTLVGKNLRSGERLSLQGSKVKEKDGSLTFRVKKISHDYGACSP